MNEIEQKGLIDTLYWNTSFNSDVKSMKQLKAAIMEYGEAIVPAMVQALRESHERVSLVVGETHEERRKKNPVMEGVFRAEIKNILAEMGLEASPYLNLSSEILGRRKDEKTGNLHVRIALLDDLEEIRGRIEKREHPALMKGCRAALRAAISKTEKPLLLTHEKRA